MSYYLIIIIINIDIHDLSGSGASPRDVYQAYIECYTGQGAAGAESLLAHLERIGWKTDSLALFTVGYITLLAS